MTSLAERFQHLRTPFYYYDMGVLDATLRAIQAELQANFHVHYAIKANANAALLKRIQQAGLGADCVSGGEIQACLDAGFQADKIVYAGVGKADWEIELALRAGIFCFNVESIPELEVINELAAQHAKTARVALRINPNVGAHTHANITTGLAENKFGIDLQDLDSVVQRTGELPNVELIGLHFHIGSQILDMGDFEQLCHRINELQDRLEAQGVCLRNINVGGGLGIDYERPDRLPDFRAYFDVFKQHLKLRPEQQVHFELGRAVVGQCGSLITRVLYVKRNAIKQFCIVDAGMTELIRPALYGAVHRIVNLTHTDEAAHEVYDIVGPICESSDVFAEAYSLAQARRGDLLALQSAGAYGEIMASQYNCRPLPPSFTSENV